MKLISNLSDEPIEKLKNRVASNEGYPTPKIDVRGYIKKGDKILLVEDTKTKKWAIQRKYRNF